jgi:hypothetical protein
MQKFEYRSPRFNVDIPVQLAIEQAILPGRCKNISNAGIRLELGRRLPLNARGTVILNCKDRPLEVGVRVAYSGKTHDGMEFLYSSDSERSAVAHLIASLAGSSNRPSLVLLD